MGETTGAVPAAVASPQAPEATRPAVPTSAEQPKAIAGQKPDQAVSQTKPEATQPKQADGETGKAGDNQDNKTEAPKQGKSAEQETADTDNGKAAEAAAIAAIADDLAIITEPQTLNLPHVAREGLAQIAAGGNLGEAFIIRGSQLIDHPEELPGKPEGEAMTSEEKNARIALGYDMKIGGLQVRQRRLAEQYKKASERAKPGIKEQYDAATAEIQELQVARANKDYPKENQLAGFAKLFGVKDKLAQQQPLVEIDSVIEQAIQSKADRVNLIKALHESDVLQTEEGEKLISGLENYLVKTHQRRNLKKAENVATKITLGALLSLILMMFSAREKKQAM